MKEQGSGTLPSDWVQQKLAQLQQEVAELSQTSVVVDQLLRLLTKPAAASSQKKELEKLLSLIITDTLNGIDISRHYPAFFEQLVTDIRLRETFLDALEILELSRAGQLEPLPGDASYDLGFLNKQAPQPEIELVESGRWRVIWQQTAAQIESLLTPHQDQSANTTFRGAYDILEDDHIILIRDKVTIDEEQYEILLEATRPLYQLDQLNLSLHVATERSPSAALQAYIQWGSYTATLTLNKYGLGRFPPLSLPAILDENGNEIIADLQIELMPI